MNKTTSNDKRLPWSTPELRRIDAGSAEDNKLTGVADGGTPPGQKS